MTEGLLKVCRTCGRYTMKSDCPTGHGATRTPHPMRYSPTDRWARYRRALTGPATEAAPAPPKA